MLGIPILVAPPTAEGKLYPRYQNSIGILTLSTAAPRPYPFGINIDNCLILDFDEDGVLANVELLRPMRAWKGKASTSPPDSTPGNLLLRPPAHASVIYDWPVTVGKNVQTDAMRIAFGIGDYNRSVSLSETCCALLADDQLTGFWFSLAR